MSIVLQGSTSGSITLQEPAVAGSNTISLPAATGTAVLTGVSGNVDINAAGSNNVTLSTNSTERVRVDSSGNVGIGTTATDGVLTVNKANAGHKIVATNGTNVAWSEIGSWAGATNQVKAQLFAEENGASSYVKIGARSNHHCAFTTNDTERMRITSGGDIGFNTNSPATSNGNVGRIYAFNGESNNCIITGTSSTAERNLLLEYRRTGRSSVRTAQINIGENVSNQGRVECYSSAANADLSGGVTLANGATSWSAISDENKKDIIEPITDGLNKVASLRSVIGKYKTDEEGIRRSFLIAQDVQAVLPEAVSTINDINGDEALGLSYTDVIPLLVAAIQELKGIVDTQATKIAELEAKLEGTA